MSSGFWAGAVPPWALAAGACLWILALLLGMWVGFGRGERAADAEEERLLREQAKARRTHPVYREPELAHEDTEPGYMMGYRLVVNGQQVYDWQHDDPEPFHPPVAAITTGEIQAITDETDIMVARWKADNDLWMAEHGLSDT